TPNKHNRRQPQIQTWCVRHEKGSPCGEGLPETDSDADISEAGRSQDLSSLTRKDHRGLLQEIKDNMAVEFSKHLAPIREGLEDRTKRTLAVEEKMEDLSTTTSTHDRALQELR
ncbi:Hypothetical predicted protein, partial [Pelobates cultripes]